MKVYCCHECGTEIEPNSDLCQECCDDAEFRRDAMDILKEARESE